MSIELIALFMEVFSFLFPLFYFLPPPSSFLLLFIP